MADCLLALASFDRDKAWRELGFGSLFQYLRVEVGLSAGAASYRKTAVELIQKVPEVTAALGDGRLCMSSVIELARVLTPENQREVLPRFFGLSRREAEILAASLRPAEVIPHREVVTALPPAARTTPEPRPAAIVDETLLVRPGEPGTTHESATAEVRPAELDLARRDPSPAAAPPRPRDVEEPLTAELSRYHLTVSREFMETLEKTRDALSHSHPGASTEEILMACMRLMLDKKAKQKGLVERPLKAPRPCRPDRIPAHVRREVMKRSGGRCEWVFENGERCNSTWQIEVDHLDPKALGGQATVERCRAACRPHNLLAARRVFGNAWMDRYARREGKAAAPPRRKRSIQTRPAGRTGTGDAG